MRSSHQLVVDAGASHVAGAVFSRRDEGKLVLEEFALETRTADPALEPGWLERTGQALVAVGSQGDLRGPAALSVPGHLTLTKFITTPALEPAKRAKVVQFEAAQAIPCPLDAVTWDHLVVAEDGRDVEIMLTAVKREVMENLCAAADAAGFPVKRAASSCLALYRAFRFNYPGVTVPVLVADIGARSTNLVLVGPGGRFLARTFPLGGNAVTAAVAENLKVDFAQAEALKLRAQAVPATLPAESPEFAAVQQAVEKFLGRLQLEIVRSAGTFSWRAGAAQPVAIYLTGGGSLIAGLGPTLATRFTLPVEHYDPLRNVGLSDRARATGAAEATHLLANLVGLAGPVTKEADVQAGLLPPAVRAAQAFRRRQPFFVGAGALMALALLPPVGHFHRRATLDRGRAAELRAQMEPMRATAGRNSVNLEKIATTRKHLDALRGLVETRASWVSFLADLQSRLGEVEDVWLDRLAVVGPPAPDAGGIPAGPVPGAAGWRLLLGGRLLDVDNPVSKVSADSYARVKELLGSCAGSPFIAGIDGERFDNSQPGLLRFDFTLVVNPQHPL